MRKINPQQELISATIVGGILVDTAGTPELKRWTFPYFDLSARHETALFLVQVAADLP